MASIRKRRSSYLLVVSMGYDHTGKRRAAQQKTVKPPEGLTPKQREKWLNEQAVLFERECKDTPLATDRTITLAQYIQLWLRDIAPNKLAKSTLARDKQDIDRFLPYLGGYKLVDLRPEHFRKLYAELRKQTSQNTGMPLSEYTVEGVHACLCGILSDAMESGFINHNPAWRTYKYSGKKKEKVIADEETMQKIIMALENESLKYETYYKLIIATGMRRGECCGLKWSDIDYEKNSIHIQRIAMPLGVDTEGVEGLPAANPRLGMLQAELPHRLKILQRPILLQCFKQVPQFRIKSGGFQGIVSPDPIGCCPVAVKHTPQAAHMGGLLELGREQRRDIVLRHIEKRIFFTDHGNCPG